MKQFNLAGRLTIYFKSTLVTENNISLRMYFAQLFHTYFFFQIRVSLCEKIDVFVNVMVASLK